MRVRQSAGLDSAAITVGLLGWSAAAACLGGAVVLATAVGLAVPRGFIKSERGNDNRSQARGSSCNAFSVRKRITLA